MKISVIYHSETGNTEKMAALVKQGCEQVNDIEVQCFPVDNINNGFLSESRAVIFGSPTYVGSCSWQIKQYLDSHPRELAGKLGGVFVSQNWPGGGGADFAEITMIAGMLVSGMLIYSGGIREGSPFLHFGAVSCKAPDEKLYIDRCLKLGTNIAKKALEIFT